MFEFKALYEAYLACRKDKRGTLNCLRFEQDLLGNLWSLLERLRNQSYRPGRSIAFLTHSPKLREVFAADFADRVVHHLLVHAVEPWYDRQFIHDVYNNRKGKGIHAAMQRAQKFMRRDVHGWYLQLDIKNFFYTLDKALLFKQFRHDIERSPLKAKAEMLWLARRIIAHDPTSDVRIKGDVRAFAALPPHKSLFKISKAKGLPIGNLTSQFFANVYMNTFDQFVKRTLKVKSYLRYVDDFVLFGETKEELLVHKMRIEHFLRERLGLTLRDDSRLRRNSDGLDFLGYIIRPDYVLVRERVVKGFRAKKARYHDAYEQKKGKMALAEIKKFLSVQASFTAHCKHANAYRLLQTTGVLHENDPFTYDRT